MMMVEHHRGIICYKFILVNTSKRKVRSGGKQPQTPLIVMC